MNHLRVLSVALICGILPFSALAGDTKPAETPLTALDAATANMLKGLDENQAKQFSAITNSHGIIRSVEDVQHSISLAVQSCSAANPDLKTGITDRFEGWKDAVRPVMKSARSKLDKMVLLQSFAQPSQVRAYLKQFDEAVVYRNQTLKPTPIQKAEDCKKLQSSMDKTQKDLVTLITETLGLNADLKIKE